MSRPPLPPFTAETAAQKARQAEDAWNTRDPARVALAYTIDSRWRNRAEFIEGRDDIGPLRTAVANNRRVDFRELSAETFEEFLRFGGFPVGRKGARRLMPLGRGTVLITGASGKSCMADNAPS